MSGKENVFFDSNVLIYHLGGIAKAKPLIESVETGEIKGFINPIVASEVMFFYIKAKTGMKSYEIKRNPAALANIDLEPIFELFSLFNMLEISTCEFYGIDKIATFDDDFKRVKTMKIVEKV
ncbi:PIN domain-containing protein [Thermococcus sp. 21S7]|uniref:PIN domain-containing protein n=1 Tax=Thermococcus sp. 21S7 TaxID=1638221 RepID=UPI00143A1B09|nr:PIN domain-containing protein [Thermococcus sp. 21S7]NJE61840.1 PIN domain-containing protein [Thermococcus sp. 21S7]